jgi:redox-sensitive bicupin YhaK (pirin superfamily)
VSNLEHHPEETACGAALAVAAEPEILAPRDVPLGGPRAMHVRRTLPHRHRRMVGAWCFVDHYGPHSVAGQDGMQVPPHPHTGLQTVSWLLEGEVLHRDSLGTTQRITPGQLNLMTAGHGISHSEQTPAPDERTTQALHGVQLWVALPSHVRELPPAFEHHDSLPFLHDDGLTVRVIMGSLGGATSAATTYTPLMGADIALSAGADRALPVEPGFEHAVLVTEGEVRIAGRPVQRGQLIYLPPGARELVVAAGGPARMLLIGGEPFEEQIVMWWNFLASDHDEIVAARQQWEAQHPRFGRVVGYRGGRLGAPALPNSRLKARGRTRDS